MPPSTVPTLPHRRGAEGQVGRARGRGNVFKRRSVTHPPSLPIPPSTFSTNTTLADHLSTRTVEGVVYGRAYGPSEHSLMRMSIPTCSVPVAYTGSCGHVQNVLIPCGQAFELALQADNTSPQSHQLHLPPPLQQPKCEWEVTIRSPLCGHMVKCPCWAALSLDGWKPWNDAEAPEFFSEAALVSIDKSNKLPPPVEKVLRRLCNQSIELARSCGREHTSKIRCADLLPLVTGKEKLKPCVDLVDRILPCTHVTKVPCHAFNDPPPVCRQKVQERYEVYYTAYLTPFTTPF